MMDQRQFVMIDLSLFIQAVKELSAKVTALEVHK